MRKAGDSLQDPFDSWAERYNRSVYTLDQQGHYPFAGYVTIRTLVFTTLNQGAKKRILDMGVGTGEITRPLYDKGHAIVGVDASETMLEKAKEGMPRAAFIRGEFFTALKKLEGMFDAILFNYALHHLTFEDQKRLIKALHPYLEPGGAILIGDVMKKDRKGLNALRKKYFDRWDDAECYLVYEEFVDVPMAECFEAAYHAVSHCAGIIRLIKR